MKKDDTVVLNTESSGTNEGEISNSDNMEEPDDDDIR
jgi:hypothetical protein